MALGVGKPTTTGATSGMWPTPSEPSALSAVSPSKLSKLELPGYDGEGLTDSCKVSAGGSAAGAGAGADSSPAESFRPESSRTSADY